MESQLDQMQKQAEQLWFNALARDGGLGSLTTLLGKIANDLRDARLMAVHPGLMQVDCYRSNAEEFTHASSHRGLYGCICGAELSMNSRIIPEKHVPTCPRCIAILTQHDGIERK